MFFFLETQLAQQKLSEELINAFRATNTILLQVNQKYKDAEKVNLPLFSSVKDYFEYLNINIVNDNNSKHNATITLFLEGTPIKANYLNIGYLYTGAKLECSFILDT